MIVNENAGREALANWQTGADPAAAHNNLAAVWIEKGNYVEARKELELALAYNKQYPAALKNLELVGRLDCMCRGGRPPARRVFFIWDFLDGVS